MSLNGRQLVDEVDFFRGAAPVYYARGGIGVALRFTSVHLFATPRLAEAFYLQHWGGLPRTGLLQCIAGDGADVQTLYLEDAILSTVAQPPARGVAVAVEYTILGGSFTTDVPPDVPGTADSAEETVVIRRGSVAIDSGATSVDVAFSAPLSTTPAAVTCTISRPAGGDAIWAIVDEDTIAVDGFTAELSGATADGSYKLNYIALE